MINSVRLRLTLWYAGVLALVLVLFAAVVYSLFRHEAYARLDDEIGSAAQVISSSLRHEIEEHRGAAPGEEAFRGVLATLHRNSFRRQGIAVYRDGRPIAAQASYDGLAPDPAMAAGARPRFATRSGVRVATYDAGGYRVLVVQRLDSLLAELNTLRRTILFAVPLTVLLAAAVSYLLARKSLQPVVAMSRDADRIGSGNLAARIEVANPRDELGQLAGTFNRLLERLQISFDRQRHFMADASHELRTPLAVQRAAIQIRLGRAAPEDIPQVQRELLDANRRSERLIEGLLMLAGGDRGLTTRSRLDLAEVLRDAVEQCRSVAAACGLALRAETAVPAPVNGDRVLLTQLALNLLHNAIRYNIPGGQVHASVSSGGVLTVSNTGPVVPADRVAELFEPFRRLGPRSEPSGPAAELGFSAGLGLSIVRSIATAHGGTVTAEPGPLGGLTVRATLPAAGAAEPARPTRTEIRV
jgi:signal transduction histidine kinase